MQQTCSRCGYVSDRPARFCRQCGSQIIAENDVTSATTRNYSQQSQPPFADQQSAGYTPGYVQASYTPGSWEEQSPNTSPFYQAPAAAQHQYPAVEQKKSFNWGKWILISFLSVFLFVVLAGGALFFWGKRAFERAMERAAAENSSGEVNQAPPNPDGPPPPPDAPAPEAAAVTLESLKYPGSTVIESAKAPFTQTIRMTTTDDLEKVKQYYDKKFGETFKNSATSIHTSDDDEKYVWSSLSNPMINIEAEPDSNDADKTQISITRVSAPIPKIVFPDGVKRN
ncbi:MAG: hypothetical protein ACRD82_23265 [Blastocatellia bacterium]